MIQWFHPIREEKMLEGYRVLSLFDGMGCAHLAMQGAGLQVERYVAFEVDRFCNEAVAHNFPDAERRGDVFDADFTEFEGFDFLMGGSPCTYWSVAQSADRRETTASGAGWELFQQYVRALREARPRWFVYENNKSMSRAIRDSISAEFGFEPIWINSALVSAQKRDRLYWVGRREEDGTYSKVPVEQPADRGILLRDVLETGEAWQDKSYPLRVSYYNQGGSPGAVEFTLKHSGHSKVAEPVGETEDGKSFVLPATYYKGSSPEQTLTKRRRTLVAEPVATAPVRVGGLPTKDGSKVSTSQSARIYSTEGKSVTMRAHSSGGCNGSNTGMYAVPVEPVNVDGYEFVSGESTDRSEVQFLGGFSREGERRLEDGHAYSRNFAQGKRLHGCDAKSVTVTAQGAGLAGNAGLYAVPAPEEYSPLDKNRVVVTDHNIRASQPLRDGRWSTVQTSFVFFPDCKTNVLTAGHAGSNRVIQPVRQVPEGTPVYEVRDGEMEIRGRKYPIRLPDGKYIIRKLTVRECMRLQTVPEWYDFSCVSNTQAYKMLGNGWTVEVIVHLLRSIMKEEEDAGSGD